MPLVVTAAANPALVPCPGVDVTVTGVTGGVISVYRSWEGKSALVRGADSNSVLGGTMAWTDYEAPFGVPITYRAVVSSGSAQSNPVTLNAASAWIQDPLAPLLSTPVTLEGSDPRPTYSRAGEFIRILGAADAVLTSGTTSSESRFDVSFFGGDPAHNYKIRGILDSAAPLLLRQQHANYTLPRLAYLGALDWTPDPVQDGDGQWRWIMSDCVIVRPQGAAIVVPARNYNSVLAEATTYGQVLTQHATYLGLLRGTSA